MIINTGSGGGNAKTVSYDNSNVNLKGTNVQGVIDELANRITFSTEEPTTVQENCIVMVYED
jgi:hypothetical protein